MPTEFNYLLMRLFDMLGHVAVALIWGVANKFAQFGH